MATAPKNLPENVLSKSSFFTPKVLFDFLIRSSVGYV